MSMNSRFRQSLNDGRYVEEWNKLTKEEQEKYENNSGSFTGYAHFVDCRATRDEKQHKKDMKDTY